MSLWHPNEGVHPDHGDLYMTHRYKRHGSSSLRRCLASGKMRCLLQVLFLGAVTSIAAFAYLYVVKELARRKALADLSKEHDDLKEKPVRDEAKDENRICDAWIAAATAAKSCIVSEISMPRKPEEFWQSLETTLDRCSAEVRQGLQVKLFRNHNNDNAKAFLDFSQAAGKESCVSLTIGVSDNTTIEEEIQRALPSCKFFAADPMPGAANLFKIGTLFPVAISNETGSMRATGLVTAGEQAAGSVPAVEFVEFLQTQANVSQIDLLMMDVEGSEYQLMPYFHAGGALDEAGINICQLSLGLHSPLQLNGFEWAREWQQIIGNFLQNSYFLPLWSDKAEPHHRTFLVNWNNLDCYKRFLRNKC